MGKTDYFAWPKKIAGLGVTIVGAFAVVAGVSYCAGAHARGHNDPNAPARSWKDLGRDFREGTDKAIDNGGQFLDGFLGTEKKSDQLRPPPYPVIVDPRAPEQR
ncbi:MAG: hypothetical protein GC137_04920 [Alphaproteobacteria bacterium]|nr:hypothetical protein [Alphaproteobacteria bacterium]